MYQHSRGNKDEDRRSKKKSKTSGFLLARLWAFLMSHNSFRFTVNASIIALVAALVAYNRPWRSFETYLTSYLRISNPKASTGSSQLFLRIMGCAEIIGLLAFIPLRTRFSLKTILSLCLASFSIGFWIYCSTTDYGLMGIASLFVGLSHALGSLVLTFASATIMPENLGLASGFANTGAGIGPALYGMAGQQIMNSNYTLPEILVTEGSRTVKYFDQGIAEWFPVYLALIAGVTLFTSICIVPLMSLQEQKKKKKIALPRKTSEEITPSLETNESQPIAATKNLAPRVKSANKWESIIEEADCEQEPESPIGTADKKSGKKPANVKPKRPIKSSVGLDQTFRPTVSEKPIFTTFNFWALWVMYAAWIAISGFLNINVKKLGSMFLSDGGTENLLIIQTLCLVFGPPLFGYVVDSVGLKWALSCVIAGNVFV